MKRIVIVTLLVLVVLATSSGGAFSRAEESELLNNGFETDSVGFYLGEGGQRFDAVKSLQSSVFHNGRQSLQIDSSHGDGWNLGMPEYFVNHGDVYEVDLWIKTNQQVQTWLVFGTWNNDDVVNLMAGSVFVEPSNEWKHVVARVSAANGITKISPRLGAWGEGTVWIDDVRIRLVSHQDIAIMQPDITISNDLLDVHFSTDSTALTVIDKRTGKTWSPAKIDNEMMLVEAQSTGRLIRAELYKADSNLTVYIDIALAESNPELSVKLSGQGDLSRQVVYPKPFHVSATSNVIIPQQEGFIYPSANKDLPEGNFPTYAGGSLSMPFWGVTESDGSYVAIIETPYDARIDMLRLDGLLTPMPVWEGEKGKISYERRVSYAFFTTDSIVPIAKQYRAFAIQKGLLVTLAEKSLKNSNLDQLVGSANIWMTTPTTKLLQEMQSLGITRVLWSNGNNPGNLQNGMSAQLQKKGYLIGSYEVHTDIMEPAYADHLDQRSVGGAWPDDIVINQDGSYKLGWPVPFDWNNVLANKYITANVLCDAKFDKYYFPWTTTEIQQYPFVKARFSDVLACTAFSECYSTSHPTTRTQSLNYRLQLLKANREKFHMITGSENGYAAFVPYLDYNEGMMSIGMFRDSHSGDFPERIQSTPEPQVEKYQLNAQYRIPLWELVFHDCMVSYWYWGDNSNKYPSQWNVRDQLNALYGTPPLYYFDMTFWDANKRRLLQSYQQTIPIARATGYYEMTDFTYLSSDHLVQSTSFANGVKVIANFGKTAYLLEDGTSLTPGSIKSYGVKDALASVNAPVSAAAVLLSSIIMMDGKTVAFPAYTINGYNYVKLRDLAYSLLPTLKSYDVVWNGPKKSIEIKSGTRYTPVGGEMDSPTLIAKMGKLSTLAILCDGIAVKLPAYYIQQSNYVRLRDVAALLDFSVSYDAVRKEIIIDTSNSYRPSN